MGFTELLSDLGTGIIDFIKIIVPGAAETVVQTFDSLAFTTAGDVTTVSAAFGWLVAGGLVFLGIGLVKRLAARLFR